MVLLANITIVQSINFTSLTVYIMLKREHYTQPETILKTAMKSRGGFKGKASVSGFVYMYISKT